jgi:hypothetical protein
MGFKLDNTVNQSKKGMVFTDTDIIACMNVRAALSNNNPASRDNFSGVFLYAEVLCLTVATVLTFTAAFFMSHLPPPLSQED